MRATISLAIVAAVAAVAGLCNDAQAENPRVAWRTDIDEAWRSTKEDQRLLLLFVKSERCVYCDKMERESYAHPQVVKAIGDDYIPAALHASKQPGLAQKMGVQAYPTTVIIDSKGQVVDAVQGYVAPTRLLQWLRAAAAKRPARLREAGKVQP